MATWKNLVMWDNISFEYSSDEDLSKDQLKEVKRILNRYVNNVVYDGYIKANRVNMNPEISSKIRGNKFIIDYNISAYPLPFPKNGPQDIFSILPSCIKIDDLVLSKKGVHGI